MWLLVQVPVVFVGCNVVASAMVSAVAAVGESMARSSWGPCQQGAYGVSVWSGTMHLLHQHECHGRVAALGCVVGTGCQHVVLGHVCALVDVVNFGCCYLQKEEEVGHCLVFHCYFLLFLVIVAIYLLISY